MAVSTQRLILTGVSAAAGVGAGVTGNVLTASPGWGWAIGFGIATLVFIVSQMMISTSDDDRPVRSTRRGAIAAGGTIDADIDLELDGPAGKAGPIYDNVKGVTAAGPGSLAAGKNIKNKIRIRSRES